MNPNQVTSTGLKLENIIKEEFFCNMLFKSEIIGLPDKTEMPKTQYVLTAKGNPSDQLLTRSDTGPIVIVDDMIIPNDNSNDKRGKVLDYVLANKLWEVPPQNPSYSEKGCITFTFTPLNSLAQHYLFFYRQEDDEPYRVQRIRAHEDIYKIGLKLFKERSEDNHDAYLGAVEMRIFGIATDAIIEGDTDLGKLLA